MRVIITLETGALPAEIILLNFNSLSPYVFPALSFFFASFYLFSYFVIYIDQVSENTINIFSSSHPYPSRPLVYIPSDILSFRIPRQ